MNNYKTKWRHNMRAVVCLQYLLSPILALMVWEICARFGFVDARFFPPPSSIFYHLFMVSPEQGIAMDIVASLSRIIIGFTLGSFLGAVLGIGMGLFTSLRIFFQPLVLLVYPIPKIAVLPLIMLVFGIGEMSKIVVVLIGSFFLVLINTLHGVDSMDKIYHDLVKVYRIPFARFVWRIVLPAILPSLFTGLKLAIGYSLVIVVAAEFSGANEGIGYLIWQSWETFSIKSMYAGVFVIGALGFVLVNTLNWLERRLIPWRQQADDKTTII